MGAALNVHAADLEGLGSVIAAAAPPTEPLPPISAPAADQVSLLATHRLSTRAAEVGESSALLSELTTAAGRLAQATGATCGEQDMLNAGGLRRYL